MTQPIPEPTISADAHGGSIFGPRRLTQAMVVIMVVISCVIFNFGGRFARWPVERGFSGSLTQPMSVVGFITAIVLLVVCTFLCTLVLGRRWFLAGLMAAAAGLTVWSVHGGTMTFVLLHADTAGANRGVLLALATEMIVLFGAIGAIWNFLWTRHAATLPQRSAKDESRSPAAAILAQAALMALFMLIIVATPAKKQVLVSVFVSAVAATAIAETFFADRTAGRWYWVGPLAVGLLGYIANFISPAGMEVGDFAGTFAGLGRVLPLDYASIGCAGTLLGYWAWSMEETSTEGLGEPEIVDAAKVGA